MLLGSIFTFRFFLLFFIVGCPDLLNHFVNFAYIKAHSVQKSLMDLDKSVLSQVQHHTESFPALSSCVSALCDSTVFSTHFSTVCQCFYPVHPPHWPLATLEVLTISALLPFLEGHVEPQDVVFEDWLLSLDCREPGARDSTIPYGQKTFWTSIWQSEESRR